LRHCLKLHEEKKFDLIVTHDWDSQLVAWEFRDLTGVKWVTTYHLFMHEIQQLEQLKTQPDTEYIRTCEWVGLHGADGVIAVSESMKRYAIEEMQVARPIKVILNGVDMAEFENCSNHDRGSYGKNPRALYCGRIAYQKGIEPLLEAIEKSEGIDWVVMGKLDSRKPEDSKNHPYHKKLEELQAAGKCKWVGQLYGEEKVKWFDWCNAVVMPSLAEPFGIVALEAMAGCKRLLHTGVDGLAEFCTPENSILIEPTADSIINNIITMRSKGYAIIHEAQQTARRFNWQPIAKETVQFYKEIYGNTTTSSSRSDGTQVSAT
jgi:glycosyltransferase involved in cell wall biosynthesis